MYTILERNENRVTIRFQNYIYSNIFVSSNEDACIKLFLRKKLFSKLDLRYTVDFELSQIIKELENIEYCYLDLVNLFTLQTQLKKEGFLYVETCLPMCKQDIVNFVKGGMYVLRPCISNSCDRPYFNKVYTSSNEILDDLLQQHRWEDIQQSISFRKRKTVDSFSKFVIQEYIPPTEFETIVIDTTNTDQLELINKFITTFNIRDCNISINVHKRKPLINEIKIINIHNCTIDYYKNVNRLQF